LSLALSSDSRDFFRCSEKGGRDYPTGKLQVFSLIGMDVFLIDVLFVIAAVQKVLNFQS
jgi:hypothetical protein